MHISCFFFFCFRVHILHVWHSRANRLSRNTHSSSIFIVNSPRSIPVSFLFCKSSRIYLQSRMVYDIETGSKVRIFKKYKRNKNFQAYDTIFFPWKLCRWSCQIVDYVKQTLVTPEISRNQVLQLNLTSPIIQFQIRPQCLFFRNIGIRNDTKLFFFNK